MRFLRRAAALTLCAILLMSLCVPTLGAPAVYEPDVTGKTLPQLLDEFRAEHRLDETNFSISYYNTVTGESYTFNDDAFFYGASTYKLPLNLYYYDLRLRGEITGDTMITRSATLDEAQYPTLIYSNNELAYSLWRRIGDWPEYKRALLAYFSMDEADIPSIYYYDHVFCTRMMMDTLQYIWQRQEDYPELLEYLTIARPDEYFKTYLHPETTPVAHKYGSYEGAENDVGIIWAQQPFLLAVYTTGLYYADEGNVDPAYYQGGSAGSEVCGELALLCKTYVDEQVRLAAEEAAREEAARLAAEEQAAREAEEAAAREAEERAAQQAAEEAAREAEKQAAQQAAEQAARAAEEQAAQQAADQARQTAHRQLLIRAALVGAFALAVIVLAIVLIRKLHKAGKC